MNVALKCFFLLVYCLWVQLLFSTFIDFCKQSMRNRDNGPDSLLQSRRHQVAVTDVEPSLLSGDAPRQIYIAQVGILLFLEAGRCYFSCLSRLILCDIELLRW